jgi:DNA-binding transcriptional regulator YhcF (GntR family)
MEIRLDLGKNAPVYRQIVEQIRHHVATGALLQGERLPTVRRLAQELQVDRNTALRAYRILQREGVISLQHGRGTFVQASSRHPQLTRHRRQVLETIMDESIARALSLGYSPAEIERAFVKRLRQWQRTRRRTAREEQ